MHIFLRASQKELAYPILNYFIRPRGFMCRNVCLSAFLCRQMFVEVHFYVLGVYVSFCVVLVKLCRNICVFKYRYARR